MSVEYYVFVVRESNMSMGSVECAHFRGFVFGLLCLYL